jgi:hypothetical protein
LECDYAYCGVDKIQQDDDLSELFSGKYLFSYWRNKMELRQKNLWISTIILSLIFGCASSAGSADHKVTEPDSLGCLTINEPIITAVAGATRSDVKIRYCSYSSNPEEELVIIIVKVGLKTFLHFFPNPNGARVYAEYQFGQDSDLLLLAYALNNPDERGNLFEYVLYKVGKRGAMKVGKSMTRPRLRNIL